MALVPASISPSAKIHKNLFSDSSDSYRLNMADLDEYYHTNNQSPLFSVFQTRTGRGAAPENPAAQTAYFSASSSSSSARRGEPQPGDSWPFSAGHNVRRRQQVSHWAETRVTPGAVTATRSATVSQWVEISSVNGSAQFSQWATQSKTQTASQDSAQLSQQVPALYNSDDFELPVVPLDLTAQLGKGNIGRKGSLGGRRPPTSRTLSLGRSSDSGAKVEDSTDRISESKTVPAVALEAIVPETCSPAPRVGKTPPPRPPPPVFRTRGGQAGQGEEKSPAPGFERQDKGANILHSIAQQEFPDTLKLFFIPGADKTSPTSRAPAINNGDDAKSTASSNSSVPPPLPSTRPPLLPAQGDRSDILQRQSVTPDPTLTDVVDIRDKESVENGEVVRRRTVVTLGPKNIPSPHSDETSVVSGTINITLKSGGSSSNSQGNYQSVKREGVSTMFVRASDQEQRPARASAFNVRRTIEQRRNASQRTNSPSNLGYETDNATPSASYTQNNNSAKSTYLFGESPSLAGSSDLSIARTLSISMSLEDLDSSTESSSNQRKGPKKNEAWYERRQSYGFEAAEKFQASKNKSENNSDVFDSSSGRSTRLSRSWDSLESHNKNGVTNFSELIPPWIRENRQADEDLQEANSQSDIPEIPEQQHSFPTYVFGEHQTESSKSYANVAEVPESLILEEPRPAQESATVLRRSESASAKERPRSTANILDDDYETKEPIWLRDLKMRRSLRESRQSNTENKSNSSNEPPWRNVKLRPTGLRLVNSETSPTRPVSEPLPETKSSIFSRPSTPGSTTSTDSRVQKLIERSRRNSRELLSPSPVPHKPTVTSPASTLILKEEVSAKTEEKDTKDCKLVHRKSIELMKLLDETPYVHPKPEEKVEFKNRDNDRESVLTRNSELTEPLEQSSAGTSLQASAEDLTNPSQRKPKKVGFAQGVKEESEQPSRPRRLRSKSPETRLKEWQAQRDARHAAAAEEAYTTYAKETNLPLTRFGDLENEIPRAPAPVESPAGITPRPKQEVSEVFRSLLQPRRPYSYPGGNVTLPETSYSKEPMPPELSLASPESKARTEESAPDSPASPERKIVVVFEETGPLPKSILKKRSLENLLDDKDSTTFETWSQRSVSSVTSSNVHQTKPSYLFSTPNIAGSSGPSSVPGTGSSTSSPSSVPWKVNLKHVDPPLRIKSPDPGESQVEWKAELMRKKAASPPRTTCSVADRSAVEAMRSATVFVARCEVATDVNPFKGQIKETPKSLTLIEEPVKHDLGYHSLEVDNNSEPNLKNTDRPSRTEPQIKIKLRPVGRPRTPEYQEPKFNGSPQKFLKKPLSPKLQHRNVVHINGSLPASPDKETSFTKEPDPIERNPKNVTGTSITKEKELHEELTQMAATSKEAEKEVAASRKSGEMATPSTNDSQPSSNWKFSFTKFQDTSQIHRESQIHEASQTESNPRILNSANASIAPWRLASRTANVIKNHEDSYDSYDPLQDSSERILTPEPDFAEFKRSLGKLLIKTENIAEFASSTVQEDHLFRIESVSGSRTVTQTDSVNGSRTVPESEFVSGSVTGSRTVSQTSLNGSGIVSRTESSIGSRIVSETAPKPPERRRSHPLTKSETVTPAERLPQKLTLGMPQDKATLLVRSFFSTSVIDTKKNRFSKTETILEESTPGTTPSLTPVTSRTDISQALEPNLTDLTITDLSCDSDDQFQLSGTELNSDFGSVLDILNASVDAQDEFTLIKPSEYSGSSVRSESSTLKNYSESERSVRLSDILSHHSTNSSRISSPRGTPDRNLSGSKIPVPNQSPSKSSLRPGTEQRGNSITSSTDNLKITSTKVVRRRNSKKSKSSDKPAVLNRNRKNSTDSSDNEERPLVKRNPRIGSGSVAKKREVSKTVPARPNNVPEFGSRKTSTPVEKLASSRLTSSLTSKSTSVGSSSVRSSSVQSTSVAAKRQTLITASKTSRGSLTASNLSPANSNEGPKTTRTHLSTTPTTSTTSRSATKLSTTSKTSSSSKPRTAQTQTRISSQRLGIWV